MNEKVKQVRKLPVLVNIETHQRFEIDRPSFCIGRGPTNNLELIDDEFASKQHSRVFWNEGWWIEDLQSSNGTTVNDTILTEPIRLAQGNIIKVGRTKFRIE